MRTNVLNDLSNVVKNGTGLACSWSQVGRMSEGAPDEHPMSIRSASDGERWKPAGNKQSISMRSFTRLAAMMALLLGSACGNVRGRIKEMMSNHALITQLSRTNHPISLRAIRYAAVLFMVFMVGIGNVWGTDFDMTIGEIRSLPTKSALITLTSGSNCTVSSGALSIANGKTGTFTISSNVSSTYKIKSIAFTVGRNVTGFTCSSGGTLSGSNKSWTFTPTSNTPVASASFSLNNTSGGAANITFVVTMTTSETLTVEELHTFSLSAGVFSFTSSAATTQIEITDTGSDAAAASSNLLQFGKSSSKTYAINIAAKTGYKLKFVSFYFYDNTSDPSKITSSVTTFTSSTNTWIGSSSATDVTFTCTKPSSNAVKICKIYVGYEVAAAKDYTVTAATSTGDNTYGTVAASASSLDEGETTTITATPATGYKVTNWAVSGTGASISPSGASNSNTTTLTMGTANATVTATFGPKSYTVTLNNQSATTAGTENVTTTYNSNTNLTSAITKPTKTGYVFAGYFTAANGGGVQLIDPSGNWIASAGGGSTYLDGSKNWKYDNNLTLYACWMEYVNTFDIQTWVQNNIDDTKTSKTFTILGTNHLLYSLAGNTELDNSSDVKYEGLKFKNSGDYVLFLVEANSQLQVTFGYVKTTLPKYSINGGAETSFSFTKQSDNQTVDFGTQTYDRLVKIKAMDGDACVLKKITITAPVVATCTDKYSFHYGPAVGDWETPICFEQVGSTHEWNITNFTIPDHTNGQFYVGYEGSTNGQSQTRAWTTSYSADDGEMLLLPTTTSIVGQAVGAIGTIVIWDNSGSANQYVGFKPDGYAIMYGGDNYVFNTTATANMLETNVVTLPNCTTTYQMGIKTASSYTTCAHSKAAEALSAMSKTDLEGGNKKVYLDPNKSIWDSDGSPKYAVRDVTNSSWGVGGSDFMTDPDGDGIYEGYVADDCTQLYFARINPSDDTPSDGWNHTEYQSVSAPNSNFQNKYTIASWSDGYGGSSSCSGPVAMSPTTGETGKFRMWANSNDNNWYVHFIPYYVLSYDANGGSGTTAATERNSESSTLTVSVASNGFTAPTGKHFDHWDTEEGDGGTDYAEGADYTLTADATLYAQWAWNTYDVSTSLTSVTVSSGTTGTGAATHGTAYTVTFAGSTGYNLPATVTVTIGGETATLTTDYTWNSSTGVLTVLAAKVTGDISISATGVAQTYSITYKDQGDVAFSGSHADGYPTTHTYGSSTTLKTASKTGYTFGGWYTSSDCSTGLVTSLGATDYTADITLYAKWTEEVAPTDVCWDPATTPADKLANNTTTLTTLTSRFAAIDGVTSVIVDNPGTGNGQCAGSDDDSGYLKVKNATTNKIITIVTTAPTNITIGGKKYGSNTGSFYLVKSTDTETKLAECNTNAEDEATNLPAGTYYIYAKASTKSINFSKLCIELYECSTPAAPTAFSAGSITSTGATFSITDAGNAASYDIYYSTSSTAPTAGTAATVTSDSKTKAVTGLTASTTYYAWVRSVCDADHKSAWAALSGSSFTTSAPAATYSVTHSLTNVTATSGATGAGAATEGVAYDAVFAANSGYVLPSTITVTIGGSPATVGTGYTWNASTGAFQVPAAQVTGAIVITIAGETAPATKDIYYGAITITAGALTKGSTGTSQFFTNIGGTIANNTEISWSSGPGTGGEYYESNVLTDTELSKSSNWNTSSGSNRYVGGMKFQNGSTYTLALGSKVASSITFYGRNGSASKTMTVGGEDWTSSSTKNTFAKHVFSKSGGFTGNVSITQDGDFYGILVITIQTATPCTTPVIPALSNQSLCEGTDIAAWNATQTAVLADGETVAYSWKKKGNDTELANTATFDLGSATESQAGTYVVTVTVSKAGKASSSAYREVELSVTEGTEVTSITADKATVYEGNSVTLTATANTTVTWQWYTCTNAAGDGESSIGGATSAAYAIASAGAAGTYYYKAKATGSCGTAEAVYTLVVSEASGGDCETEFWFAKAADKPEGATAATHISGTPSGSSSASYTATIDGNNYTITGQTGQKTGNVTITVPEDYEGTLYVVVQGSSSRTITLSKGGVQVGQETPANSTWGTFTFSNLDAGTYTLVSSGNIGWGILALKLCSAVACSDPEVTASADNTTACVGTSVTFTAANAHAEATYQWQKLDGTWTDISGETESTYNIASVVAGDAGKYRVIASHNCNRTSNEVTLSVPSAPDFGSTVPSSVSVMQTIALSINTVEATDAVKYRWYKSADDTWDAGDVEIGTNKELIKAYDSEAIGSPSYYIFCRAQNACGITTSTAIAVNVTDYVEEDCATRGNEGDAQFGFEYSAGQATYNSTACWSMNDNSKKLIYAAPEGKYFKTMKVTIASSSASKASYNWSTNGGTDYTAVSLTVNSTLTERTIDVSAHGNVNALQIGRNFNSTGESSGTLYVSKICFEYTDACTATTVTPDESSKTYEMGGAWSNPTFTLTPAAVSGETLTYSSSNEDIASVDDDGTVTFNGDAGTVTITASYAGGTISATDYCASSGSYTITVSCTGGAPKVVPDGTVNMSGCNSSITLNAKKQDGTAFADGTYKWFRNGEEIDGATSSSYTATQAGTYTVERTNGTGCTTPSTNSAVVTSETTEPEVERLVPFQYYHVDKTYSDQMKMRHLFAVKNSGKLDGKSFKMYVSRSGGAATDVTSSNALEVWPSDDGPVDTVMVDLNKLSGKYSENDELVFTCKAIDCSGNVSDVYKETITMNVIGETPTLALICSGSSKAGGTRKTGELTVGGDFLTGYNVADLCEQTGSTSFDANTEWGLYTDLKTKYIVTPVNGYAVFNKLNYEPFDILLLTDYPKASKSDAAADVLDDMAALCDYRPMLSFKTHMVAKSPSKWAKKGFTTSPVVTKADGRLNLNIVCYAHPMFNSLKTGDDVYTDVGNTSAPLVYTMLSGTGYESSKGMQGFELAAAENFVTIGLTHYNGTIAKNSPDPGEVEWTPGSEDRMLVTVAERQANPEARFILFSLNCGAQSKLTDKGEEVVLACLNYLLGTAEGTIEPADCSFTFDNGENNEHNAAWYASNCPLCTGTKGDGKWTTAANWGPDYRLLPGEFTSVRIKKPVEVDDTHAHVMEVRIIDEGRIDIPAGKALDVKSTIRRMDGTEIYPTEENDIHIGSASTGNGTLIFNNDEGDTKARVDMYSTAKADMVNMSAATSTWQYIGTPHSDVASATHNYYNSWLYQYSGSGWEVIPNGGPLVPFRGYCVTHPDAPVVFGMEGTLVATTAQDIAIPAGYTVIANSWTAPIDINAITDDDMEGISDKTIYFFNTGNDVEGDNTTGTEAGTYRTTPIHSASYTGDWQIPSMQGFYISTTSAGTLHLDYDRHVRPTGSRSVVSNPMYAPRRAATESDEPNVLKIFARGSRYQDKLVVLEREDFSRGYDSGWDGEAWGGGTLSPMVYVIGEGREDAVSAIPEFEGTVVAFKAGEDEEYTIDFIYDAENEPLYLFDTENSSYTQIMTGESYYFSTDDKAPHSRFILTRKAPQIATGVEPTSDGEGAKARKLLIEDKMYILLNGMLYDATGKVVK
jgi:uncharacterized repeat protein (TIGR02543 family)